MWRDFKIRYRQTAAWALVQPLTTVAGLSPVFGRLVRIPSEGLGVAATAVVTGEDSSTWVAWNERSPT